MDSTVTIAVGTAFLIFLGMRVQYFYLEELKLPGFVSSNFGWFIARGFDTLLYAVGGQGDASYWPKRIVLIGLLSLVVLGVHRPPLAFLLGGQTVEPNARKSWRNWRCWRVGLKLIATLILAAPFAWCLERSKELGKISATENLSEKKCKWVQLTVAEGEKPIVGKLLGITENDYLLRVDDLNLVLPRSSVTSATYRLDQIQPPISSPPAQ